ncbi:MAG: hypothetical protein IGQ88_00330 [Gloeomargaritaceae cyanobacterium C42_A2020_066]|nr:hypothetical protein [Gloeomargaritaceae cyanobacterium C42_A2020_066]
MTYSLDLRKKVIGCLESDHSITEIARIFNISYVSFLSQLTISPHCP